MSRDAIVKIKVNVFINISRIERLFFKGYILILHIVIWLMTC